MGEALKIHLTYEDYQDMPEDGRRYEIIDGRLAVSPTPIIWHQMLVGRLYLLLVRWSESGAGGMVILSPATVILAYDTIVEPDIFWIAPDRVNALVKDVVHGGPDLVIEVQSPSTAKRDRGVKAQTYAHHGVREYWLVDPVSESVTIFRLKGSSFTKHASGGGDRPLTSSIDPKLVVIPSELFRR